MRFSLVQALLLLRGADALRVPALATPRRCSHAAMQAPEATCCIIEMSSDDPLRIATVLKKAWMEGGVKRGLKGSVVVGEAGKVQIVASGKLPRLQAFAEWCSSQLASEVDYYVDADACPAVDLTSKFELSEAADLENQPWAKLLQGANEDIEAVMGKSHSSDEGLA